MSMISNYVSLSKKSLFSKKKLTLIERGLVTMMMLKQKERFEET